MRILFSAMQWDYGNRAAGFSFEYVNFFETLDRMEGVDVGFFDFMDAYQAGGHDAVRSGMKAAIEDFRPDLLFTVLFEEEVPADLLAELRDRADVLTYNWFCDDHWRFESFTSRYAPLFNFVSTTARSALPKYAAAGIDHVLKTQWACNQFLYKPTGNPPNVDVSFVGQPHGDRRWVINRLRRAGIDVAAFGKGWPTGRLEQDAMVAMFAESRINLNLSNASQNPAVPRLARKIANRTYPPALKWLFREATLDQIKGRNFEIPGCGGFQLSGWADDIETYFDLDREIVLYRTVPELIDAIERYSRDEPQRAAIARAGYERTLADHTYEHRFRELFAAMDLPVRK